MTLTSYDLPSKKEQKENAVKKVKKKKLYAKRFVQANLFLFPLLLIAPTAYQLTLPERAPLPYNATDVFDQQLDELNHLTRTKINIKYLYDDNIQSSEGDDVSSTCINRLNNIDNKHFDDNNIINKNMKTTILDKNNIDFLNENLNDNSIIDTYLLNDNLIYDTKDDVNIPGIFTFIFIVLNNDATTKDNNNNNKIILGQKRHGWIFVSKEQMCSSTTNNYQTEIMNKLHDHLSNPGQHLPNGIEIIYPSYHVTLSLLVENPDEKLNLKWNNEESNGFIEGFLHPSSRMKRLGKFFNVLNQHIATFTIDSQLLYYVKLTGAFRKAILKGKKQTKDDENETTKKDNKNYKFSYVRPKDLRRFISMNDHLNYGSGLLGNLAKEVHFAAFIPSIKHSPLTLGKSKSQILENIIQKNNNEKDEDKYNKQIIQTIQQQMNGFIIPRWGGVTIINTEKPSDEDLNNDDFQRFESMILAHARSLLGLNDPYNFPPPSPTTTTTTNNMIQIEQIKPIDYGIADWEIDAIVNYRMKHHGRKLTEMVNATLTLATKMSGLIIHKEIGECVNRAVNNLERCINVLNGNYNINTNDQNRRDVAFSWLRDGFLAAEEANRDPSMVTQQYFPMEQMFAILCPLLLPIIFPVIMGVTEAYKREWKRYKGEEVSESDSEMENIWEKFALSESDEEEEEEEEEGDGKKKKE